MKRRRAILFAILFIVAGCALYLWREAERGRRFLPQIRAAGKRYGVDPLLIKAVVWQESRFDPDVLGRKGEIGLMQLQEVAAQEWADFEKLGLIDARHCLDPATNTLAGAYYLGKLLKRYAQTDDPVPYALADYNAGRSNLLKWNSGSAATNSQQFVAQIGFPGTQNYVKSVMRRYAMYRFLARLGWT